MHATATDSGLCFTPIGLSYVIPCYFDQDNNDSLASLLRGYAAFDPLLLDRIQFVVVDDGSPVAVAIPPDIDLNILLLRINENIPWNQAGARNLGLVYCRSDKVLATDLDHEFSEPALRYLVDHRPLCRTFYRVHRRGADGAPAPSHPNTFFLSRGRFLKFYGVDEEFAGAYGCEDGMFWRWQRYNGTRFRYLPERYASRRRSLDRERSYHSLVRDNTRNSGFKRRKKREWALWGPVAGHSRKFLAFTWRLIEDRKRRETHWRPPANRTWKRLFLLRQWFGC